MNAIIYCRVSTKEQSEHGHSLRAQEKECRAFAAVMGLTLLETFIEEGESAKTISRTQLSLMLKYIRQNKERINALIVWDIDRLSRNPRDYYELEGEFRNYGIDILTVKGTNDASPIGKLVRSISVSLSEFENEQKKERVSAGMRQALEQGRWPWKPPLGYTRGPSIQGTGPLVPDPATGDLVREAFRMMASGVYTQLFVLRHLGDKGLSLSPQTLNKILRNPIYCGLLRSDFFPEMLPGNHEPLVDKAEFMKVQEIMRKNQPEVKRPRSDNKYPLRRFVRCARCDSPYTGGTSRGHGGTYDYYRCRAQGCDGSIPARILERRFSQWLEGQEIPKEVYDQFCSVLLEELEHGREERDRQLAQTQEQLHLLQESKATMLHKLATGTIKDEEYRVFAVGAEQRILQLEIEEATLSADTIDTKIPPALYTIGRIVSQLQCVWEDAMVDEKRILQKAVFPEGVSTNGRIFLNPGISMLFRKLTENNEDSPRSVKRAILNPVTSLQDKKIPALAKRVSTVASPRGIEPLLSE